MSRLRVAPIVTGHGEVECIRILLERLWYEILHGEYIDVLRGIRRPQGKLEQQDELQKAVRLARGKLHDERERGDIDKELVLIVLDQDRRDMNELELETTICDWARQPNDQVDVACVVIRVEYETLFVASAESMGNYFVIGETDNVPDDPEAQGCGEHWVTERFRTYRKTKNQAGMTSALDFELCQKRSPSFCRLRDALASRA